MMRNQFFIIFVISLSLLIGNGEAGWKFWKKDKETTTTTTATSTSVFVESISTPTRVTTARPTSSTISIGAAIANTGNLGLALGADITGQNVRNNARPNPGTEVGLDIGAPKSNKLGLGGGNGQSYRDWAAGLTGAGEYRNQSTLKTSTQRPPISGIDPAQPNLSTDSKSTSVGNIPIQPTQPSIAGSRSEITSQPLPQSTALRPASTQPTPGHITASPVEINRNRPNTLSSPNSSGKTWADVAAGGNRPASPMGVPNQPVPDNSYRITPGRPTQPNQPNNPTRSVSSGSTMSAAAGAAGVVAARATIRNNAGSVSGATAADSTKTYSDNPTYSKGNMVTDEDLEKLSEALYIKDTNNANRFITVNLQKQTTSGSPIDQAPQPLLTVNAEAFHIPTIQRVLSIFDNYQLDTHTNEYISPAQRQEESLLVDTFLSTNVMSVAMRFLADKGFIRKDYYEYKDRLRMIWFNLFSRGQGKIGSTGFEHVFMTETKQVDSGIEVLGLHNWIYFNAEEAKRRADYLGYIKKIDLGNKGSIIKMHAKFNGNDKPVTTMFIGTSPELEMALYTVCFFTRPDRNCLVSLGNTKFNIVTHKFRYRGKDLIGTAYPEI